MALPELACTPSDRDVAGKNAEVKTAQCIGFRTFRLLA
jgi:hypothetical protein